MPRGQVLDWERRRAQVVLRKLGVTPLGSDVPTLNRQLLARKLELGPDRILHLLRLELAVSDQFAALTARLSFGARRFSMIELVVDGGAARQFVDWFNERGRINDETAMLAGTPDHYVLRIGPSGAQEVVETTGGSPSATRFFIDYDDLSSLRSTIDLDYPLQIAGVARSAKGLAIGGVRHQFRDEGRGFRVRLLVEFPLLILPSIVSGHQWHLASEFSHWIEAAFA
ncbi:MAG TPA: hypothetical protein VM553_08015 [Dongiaceae bacterium]|nr:hypothetical protein [Dongiaceae bacterium]